LNVVKIGHIGPISPIGLIGFITNDERHEGSRCKSGAAHATVNQFGMWDLGIGISKSQIRHPKSQIGSRELHVACLGLEPFCVWADEVK